MPDIGTLIAVMAIVLAASFLQAGTGFGFSIMATPLLMLIYPAHAAIQINIILSIFLSLLMMPATYKQADKQLLVRLLRGSVPGIPIGLIIYAYLNLRWLELFAGVFILLVTVLLMFRFRIRPTRNRDGAAGVLSGLLTTSVGIPGPPLLIYFAGTGMEKARLRGTILTFYVFIYSVSLIMQIAVGGKPEAGIWIMSALSIPVVLLGTVMGQRLFLMLNQTMFQRLTYVLLLITGAYLTLTNII